MSKRCPNCGNTRFVKKEILQLTNGRKYVSDIERPMVDAVHILYICEECKSEFRLLSLFDGTFSE